MGADRMNERHVVERSDIEDLYRRLLDAWNQRDAEAMAACFSSTGTMIGFDGSTEVGSASIVEHLAPIFRDHPTAAYVHIVEDVAELAPGVAMLRASVGMVAPGTTQLNPAANAIQCCVARQGDDGWKVELFQNTPAAFHGRPHLADAMTSRLQAVLEQVAPVQQSEGAA
jgi:uncharacterized protein (TIGR02246 family)